VTKYYTTSDVAKICNVHRNTIIGAIRKGLLKIHRTPGGHARISQEDLDDFCHRRSLPATDEIVRNNRVLILDADPEWVSALSGELRDFEYEVQAARDSFMAGYLLGRFEPNVVLVDVEIGDMRGDAICRSIRSLPRHRDTAIIGVTGVTDQDAIDRLVDGGVDDMLRKPVDVKQIVDRIERLVGPIIYGTSGRATTGRISGKITKRVRKSPQGEEEPKETRRAEPRRGLRTTHDGVLLNADDEDYDI
jgi:two-component system, OmpR family, response regulator VicR